MIFLLPTLRPVPDRYLVIRQLHPTSLVVSLAKINLIKYSRIMQGDKLASSDL